MFNPYMYSDFYTVEDRQFLKFYRLGFSPFMSCSCVQHTTLLNAGYIVEDISENSFSWIQSKLLQQFSIGVSVCITVCELCLLFCGCEHT